MQSQQPRAIRIILSALVFFIVAICGQCLILSLVTAVIRHPNPEYAPYDHGFDWPLHLALTGLSLVFAFALASGVWWLLSRPRPLAAQTLPRALPLEVPGD